jgi:hypothetical protein
MPAARSEKVFANTPARARSAQRGQGVAAEFDTLDAQAAADIGLLREFTLNRERHMARLFGRTVRRSPLRDELLRLVMLNFAQGALERVATYVRACADFATGPSVRSEIETLVSTGVVVLVRDEMHPRAYLVAPTTRVVAFYNEQMPRLRHELLLLARAQLLAQNGTDPKLT